MLDLLKAVQAYRGLGDPKPTHPTASQMAVKLTAPSGPPQVPIEKPTQVVGPQSAKREEKIPSALNVERLGGPVSVPTVRTSFPFRSDCQSKADLGSAYRLAPQSLGP